MDKHTVEHYWMRKAMRVYGGSFVQSLGNAMEHADANNYSKLITAFPEYVKQYTEMGQKLKEKDPEP